MPIQETSMIGKFNVLSENVNIKLKPYTLITIIIFVISCTAYVIRAEGRMNESIRVAEKLATEFADYKKEQADKEVTQKDLRALEKSVDELTRRFDNLAASGGQFKALARIKGDDHNSQ